MNFVTFSLIMNDFFNFSLYLFVDFGSIFMIIYSMEISLNCLFESIVSLNLQPNPLSH